MLLDNKYLRGFTLLELMLALLVISVLVTLAIPAYKKVVTQAKVTKAKNAISLLIKAEKIYMQKYDVFKNANSTGEAGGGISLMELGNLTGVDITELDIDPDWHYKAADDTVDYIQAKDKQDASKTIKFYLNGSWEPSPSLKDVFY